MAQSRKLIKARIRSVKNTGKITKAMELVAASKMRRAVSGALKTRPYARIAWEAVREILAHHVDVTHALLVAKPGATRTLVVLFTSDRGLAGGFNVNIMKALTTELQKMSQGSVDVIAIGKRGSDAMQRAGIPVLATFVGLGNAPRYADMLPALRMAVDAFAVGTYRKVMLAYTDYVSGITQRPVVRDVLPLVPSDDEIDAPKHRTGEFLFEPSPSLVLDTVLPGVVGTMFYQALLESSASEHAARMVAMKSASDAASDMQDALTFTYNQARQAAITQEIAEISSGKAALE